MKKVLSMLTTFALLLALAACGNDTSSEVQQSTSAPKESAVSQTEQQTGPQDDDQQEGHYPVTITNYNYAGEEVTQTFEQAPEKVLAVYQGCIEIMIALGLEDHVLASYGLDNEVKAEWQAGFASMNYDDSVFAPDMETVVMLQPDFILSWNSYFGENKLGDVDYWQDNGTGTYITTNTRAGGSRTLENEYLDILNIGKIFNVEEKAEALVEEIKAEVDRALSETAGQESETVAILEYLGDNITNYGANTLGGDMVTTLGGTLAIPDGSSVGNEDIIDADPDVIFIVYMAYSGEDGEDVMQTNLAYLLEDASLASLSAIQNGRVYPIMLGDMYASAARTGDGIATFAAGLYPSLYE